MSSRSTLAAVGTVVLAAAAIVGAKRAVDRWAAHEWCCDDPMPVPDGDDFEVETSDGARLAGTVARPAEGDAGGRTFVLPHCLVGHRGVWGHVAHHLLDEGHTVVLYDQRGHGASTVGDDGISVERLGTDLREVLDHLGVERCTLAGHSMGGMTVQQYLVDHADHADGRVDGAVLVATTAGGQSRGERIDRMVVAGAGRGRHPGWLLTRVGGGLAVRHQFGTRAPLAQVLATRDMYVSTPSDVLAACLRSILSWDIHDRIEGIEVPVVVVHGRRDLLLPLRFGRRIAERVPGSQLDVLSDAGHMVPLERPDVVARHLLDVPTSRTTTAA